MSMAEQKKAEDVCPICGKQYKRVIEPEYTELIGPADAGYEGELMDGLCAISVGEDVWIYDHHDNPMEKHQ